jgi:hypothetical protein
MRTSGFTPFDLLFLATTDVSGAGQVSEGPAHREEHESAVLQELSKIN